MYLHNVHVYMCSIHVNTTNKYSERAQEGRILQAMA
jgi:hypothetical protein